MLTNKFVREDGSVIDSSSIISCVYFSSVNSANNLTVGDITADEVEVVIRTPSDMIVAGERLVYYQVIDGTEHRASTLRAEAPTVASKNSIRFKAYDDKAKLEADFSEWLEKNQSLFPMTLGNLLYKVGNVAGAAILPSTLANNMDGLMIPAFLAQGVTCRQIVSWAAQLSGQFVRCDEYGTINFQWYSSFDSSVYMDDILQDSLNVKPYMTDPIQRVQIKQATNDIGVIYPSDADGNTFTISQNGLAALLDSNTLNGIAKYLYDQLNNFCYTPISFRTFNTQARTPGTTLTFYDSDGRTILYDSIVMSVRTGSSGTEVSSTGDQSYADKAAVASERYQNIPGKVLSLEKSVDGLTVRSDDLEGNYSELRQSVVGIDARVENAEDEIATLAVSQGTVKVTATKGGGTLTTVIDGSGTWESKFTKNGAVKSSLVFDFDDGEFVLTGGTLQSTMVFVPESVSFLDTKKNGTWLDGNGIKIFREENGLVITDNTIAYAAWDQSTSRMCFTFSSSGLTIYAATLSGSSNATGPFTFSDAATFKGAGTFSSAGGDDTSQSAKAVHFGNVSSGSFVDVLSNGIAFYHSNYKPDGQLKYLGRIRSSYSSGGANYAILEGEWRGTLTSNSDAKLKNTIRPFDESYSALFDALRPRTYKWNDGTSGRTHSGFVVQEVVEAINEAGLTTKDFAAVVNFGGAGSGEEDWGLRYEEMIPLNTWQIQKLKARVAELERRLG